MTDGRKDGRTEGRTDGSEEGRKDGHSAPIPISPYHFVAGDNNGENVGEGNEKRGEKTTKIVREVNNRNQT